MGSATSRTTGRATSRTTDRATSGRRTTPRVGPQSRATHRTARPRYASGRRAALRVGPQGRATRRAAGPRYAPDRRVALRVGPPGRATCRPAGRAARWTNYSATAPLDLRTNGRTTKIHTNGQRGPAPLSLECTAGFMYRTLGIRSGVCWSLLHTAGPDNLGSVIRHGLHVLGPAAILGPGPKQGREEQRGPTRGGTGGMQRIRQA